MYLIEPRINKLIQMVQAGANRKSKMIQRMGQRIQNQIARARNLGRHK